MDSIGDASATRYCRIASGIFSRQVENSCRISRHGQAEDVPRVCMGASRLERWQQAFACRSLNNSQMSPIVLSVGRPRVRYYSTKYLNRRDWLIQERHALRYIALTCLYVAGNLSDVCFCSSLAVRCLLLSTFSMSEDSLLSVRARNIHEDDRSINGLWDTLDNLWDPRNNPSGIVSLGVAENVCLQLAPNEEVTPV